MVDHSAGFAGAGERLDRAGVAKRNVEAANPAYRAKLPAAAVFRADFVDCALQYLPAQSKAQSECDPPGANPRTGCE